MSDHANGYAKNETVQFEHSDVHTRVILWFVAGLAVSLAAVMGVMWLAIVLLTKTQTADKESDYPLAKAYLEKHEKVVDRLPPTPRLEGMAVDLPGGHTIGRTKTSTAKTQAAREESDLATFNKQPDGTVRIPIAEAIRKLAKPGKPPVTEYDAMPNGSSSGRTPNGGAP